MYDFNDQEKRFAGAIAAIILILAVLDIIGAI